MRSDVLSQPGVRGLCVNYTQRFLFFFSNQRTVRLIIVVKMSTVFGKFFVLPLFFTFFQRWLSIWNGSDLLFLFSVWNKSNCYKVSDLDCVI